MEGVGVLNAPREKTHSVMLCELKHAQGRAHQKDLVEAVFDIYDRFVHATHMDLLGLPRDMRNWEQVEAYDMAAELSKTIVTEPYDLVLRRTIFTAGRDNKIVKVVDLVHAV